MCAAAFITCMAAVFLPYSTGSALDYSGTVSIEAVNVTGSNTWVSYFESGSSKLVWPIDLKTLGLGLSLKGSDLFEVRFNIATAPWYTDSGYMKDYDYLIESQFSTKPEHDGVDLYSESELDSKALIMDLQARVFPLRTRFFSAGLTAGYRQEEYDYRAYNTRQTGYGPWQNQTAEVSGPTSFYSINYDIFSLGLALKSTLDNITLAFEASALPWVGVNDEDEHLKRNRVLYSETTGSGYQTSFSGTYSFTNNWSFYSTYTYIRISTDGEHDQHWYGDDPITSYDDTGASLLNVDTDIRQESSRIAIGVTRQF